MDIKEPIDFEYAV